MKLSLFLGIIFIVSLFNLGRTTPRPRVPVLGDSPERGISRRRGKRQINFGKPARVFHSMFNLAPMAGQNDKVKENELLKEIGGSLDQLLKHSGFEA